MLKPQEEQELRTRTAELVLTWHLEHRGALEATDTEGYATLVEAAAIVVQESDTSLRNWVWAARRAGVSWEEIGTRLGVSRQAAQKRFAPVEIIEPGSELGEPIVRHGVTAFNEVQTLRDEGALGRKLVGAGVLKLFFVQTDQRWENIRVASLRRGRSNAEMEADGWQHVASWYPFTYYTRPLR